MKLKVRLKTGSFLYVCENLPLTNFQCNIKLLWDFRKVKFPVSSRLAVSLTKKFKLCFSPESCHNNNITWPISYLSKNHFLSKKGPKQVPWIIFVRLTAIFSKTAVKMASKRIKNVVQKTTFTGPTERFYYFKFFCWFCPFLGTPPRAPWSFQTSDLRKFKSIHTRTIPKKQNWDIFKTKFSTNLSI
jgi:hypothetical protein